MFAATADT